MKISDLALKTGATIRSLRYYEQKGLISSKRLPNGYREFDEGSIPIVKTIQLYLSLGLNSKQIGNVLRCQDLSVLPSQEYICDSALLLYEEKRREVIEQMNMLQEIKEGLENQIAVIRQKQVEKDKQRSHEKNQHVII